MPSKSKKEPDSAPVERAEKEVQTVNEATTTVVEFPEETRARKLEARKRIVRARCTDADWLYAERLLRDDPESDADAIMAQVIKHDAEHVEPLGTPEPEAIPAKNEGDKRSLDDIDDDTLKRAIGLG